MVTNKRKKDIWVEITQNVNAMGSGQKRTKRSKWNLDGRIWGQEQQRANKDVVLDIIGGENSKALQGIQGVVGDGEPTIVEESEPVPPNAEETFILDLSPIIEEPGRASSHSSSEKRLEASFAK